MTDAEKFLARFRAFGAKPDPDAYVEPFDARDGTVLLRGERVLRAARTPTASRCSRA